MKKVNIITKFSSNAGGTENRALQLYALLSEISSNVFLWADDTDIEFDLSGHPEINKIGVDDKFPTDGTLVIVGAFWNIGDWIEKSKPERVVIIHNTPYPKDLLNMTIRLTRTRAPIEIRYAAKWLYERIGQNGSVEISPIDLVKFRPRTKDLNRNGEFTVGRLSRDLPSKHFLPDVNLYNALASKNIKVKIMGGKILKKFQLDEKFIDILPECAISAENFLSGLDCFYYRTAKGWFEPHGRVITEAMAFGLPVIAHKDGGYNEFIEHGVDGFLFENQSEAYDLINLLKNDLSLRDYIGSNAHKKMNEVFGPTARDDLIKFYLG